MRKLGNLYENEMIFSSVTLPVTMRWKTVSQCKEASGLLVKLVSTFLES